MTIPHEVVTDVRRYQVVTDLHLTLFVLAWGRVTDLTTAKAPRAPFTATTALPHSVVKVFEDGFWCVAGVPERCFEDLTVANSFAVDLASGGYSGAAVTVNIPANPLWSVDAGTQPLSPFPVRLQGRVVRKLNGLPVINGKVIAVDPIGPALAPRPFALRSLLKQNHAAGAAIQGVALNPVALAPARKLGLNSQLGSAVITVNNRTSLAIGQIIRFRDEASGEYGRIASVSALPANLALPGEVTLETPVRKSFPRTTAIDVFAAGAAVGPSMTLQQPASGGEGVLQLNGYPSGDVLRLTEAGLVPEFHAPGALTDAQGYFAIDGVARVNRIFLGVEAAGFTSPPNQAALWVVDYSQAVNVMDFRLV